MTEPSWFGSSVSRSSKGSAEVLGDWSDDDIGRSTGRADWRVFGLPPETCPDLNELLVDEGRLPDRGHRVSVPVRSSGWTNKQRRGQALAIDRVCIDGDRHLTEREDPDGCALDLGALTRAAGFDGLISSSTARFQEHLVTFSASTAWCAEIALRSRPPRSATSPAWILPKESIDPESGRRAERKVLSYWPGCLVPDGRISLSAVALGVQKGSRRLAQLPGR